MKTSDRRTGHRLVAPGLNYHHLRYFWTVARTGSIARASAELHLSQPAISAQIKTLERSIGHPLVSRRGRGLELTDTGRLVARYAEEIFTLGRELRETVAGRPVGRVESVRIGLAGGLPTWIVEPLLAPVLARLAETRLVISAGPAERLFADLAARRLDVVLADAPAPPTAPSEMACRRLVESAVRFFASRGLATRLRRRFPGSLEGAPIILPAAGTALRRALDAWFAARKVRPVVRGEIDDPSLAAALAALGDAAFAGPAADTGSLERRYGVRAAGDARGVKLPVYLVTAGRTAAHPAVKLLNAARRRPAPRGRRG